MSSILDSVPLDLVKPSYNIYRYTDEIYKIVHFKHTLPSLKFSGEKKHYDEKLDSSISRAKRVILELALSNEWCYFATFTISSAYDRSDLKGWNKKFKQWIRDLRKKYDKPFRFVLVPEKHHDGSWHMHGLMDDSAHLVSFKSLLDSGENVPFKLAEGDYYNWIEYQKKFGFCSFAPIRDKVAVSFYITKYISKSLSDSCMPVGMDLYSASDGLNRAVLHGDVFGENAYLNSFLSEHYEFCDTGFTRVSDSVDWDFALEYMDFSLLESFGFDSVPEDSVVVLQEKFDNYFEAVQEVLNGF